MEKFRITAIVLNCIGVIIVLIGSAVAATKPWYWGESGALIFLLVGLIPFVNLIYILIARESWLSLYFQRIAAENRERLAELKAEKDR